MPTIQGQWPRVVDLTSRAFASSVTSRAACKLLCAVIEADLLEYTVFTEAIMSILSSANLNGPSAISDTSLYFWALIARRRNQTSLASAQNASKQICSWLREVWTIGMGFGQSTAHCISELIIILQAQSQIAYKQHKSPCLHAQ